MRNYARRTRVLRRYSRSGDNFSATCSNKNAKEGDKITVSVTPDEFFEIDSVTANGVACTLNAQGQYEFTMPAEDVTVEIKVKPAPDVDEDGGMVWSESSSQLAVVEEGDDTIYTTQTFEVSFGNHAVPNVTVDGYLSGVEVFSLNPDVIPDEAISGVKPAYAVGSLVTKASFEIDLTKIKEGEARLVFKEDDRVLVKTIRVVDFDEVTPENLYTEKVVVDMSRLSGSYDNMRIWIIDEDYVQGSVYKSTQFDDFVYSADEPFEYEFKYTPDHTFRIAVGYEYYDEDRQMYVFANFEIDDEILPSTNTDGYSSIVADVEIEGVYYISYAEDGITLEATVRDN